MHALLRWASDDLPDTTPDPYEDPLTAEQIRAWLAERG
jgi:hypothetical protein